MTNSKRKEQQQEQDSKTAAKRQKTEEPPAIGKLLTAVSVCFLLYDTVVQSWSSFYFFCFSFSFAVVLFALVVLLAHQCTSDASSWS